MGAFDDLIPQAPQQPRVGFIPGTPKPGQGVDLARDAVALQREREQLERDRAEEERRRREFSDKQRGLDASGGIDATVEQGKAASFYLRARRANEQFNQKNLPSRGVLGEVAASTFPMLTNAASSTDRQISDSAIRDFVAATLRYESGAAIPPEELETQRRIYFPMPGDSEETLRAKAQQRATAIEGLRIGAGPASVRADEAPGNQRLTDEQITAELRERISRGDAPEATIRWLIDNNRPPDEKTIAAIIGNAGNRNPDVRPPNGGSDIGRRFAMGLGDVVEGIGDIAGIVGNPINAGINALAGTNLSIDLGQTFRDATGLPSPETNSEQTASAINRGGVGALSLAGAARSAVPLATGALESGLARFGAMPLTDTVAGASSGASAEIARQNGAGPVGQTAAALVGGGLALPAASRVNSLLDRPAPVQNALTRAGEAEGVTVNRAMADPGVQNRVTGVDATLAGGPIVRRDMGTVGNQIEAGVQRLGGDGAALDPSVAGQSIQRVAERSIKVSGQQAKRQYDRAEKAAGDVKVAPSSALQVIDDLAARLSETSNTNSKELAYLAGLKGDLSKPISVGALRDLRTTLRKQISKGELTFGQNEARVLGIMDAVSGDIERGLKEAGKAGAARLFRKADEDYRARMEFIGGTVQKIIGKRGANLPPEEVFRRFRAMASPKGDEAGLARMMREMEPEERADIAATFAEELGKNGKGEFSTAFLLTQAAKLPKAARFNIFGKEGATSLDNLLTLAKEHARVMGGMNHSRTGVTNDYRSWLSNLVFGGGTGLGTGLLTQSGFTGAAIGVGTAIAGATVKGARDILTARALMTPDIAKWLATAPRTNSPQAINAHFGRLATMAARNPSLADEIGQIQQAIMKAANENVSSAAASGGNEQQ